MDEITPRWTATPCSVAAAHEMARLLGVSPALATVLIRRGYTTPEEATAFLRADERHDAGAFDGMGEVCERILGHVRGGSTIVVHGDYDVDGVCSAAILIRALRGLGANPRWHLPSRFDGGYGVSREFVRSFAEQGGGLLVTTDCGIGAVAEIEEAVALGVDVVVTDHHRLGERLPPCAVIHPVVCGYPFQDLCASGVALKVAEGLVAAAGADPALAARDLDLAALATVCDVVPLRGENRRIVREGLAAIAATGKVGLRALMRVAALDPAETDARALGFRLGPRLNAAGRLGRADAALELLLTEDEPRAAEVADELDHLNRERRDTETRILFAAEAARAGDPDAPVHVLAGEGWHQGVIGIVASRLVERHHRPCVLIALDRDGGRGSGRSIAAYDLHAGLSACAEHLRRFGGHRAAAGFDIDPERVDAFRAALSAHARAALSPEDLRPVERVDAVIPCGAASLALAEELQALAPFGHENPEPSLLLPAVRIEDVRGMGEERQHSRFALASGGARVQAVAFRRSPGSLAGEDGEPYDVVARLECNDWNGVTEPRLSVRALCPTEPGPVHRLEPSEPFWEAVCMAPEEEAAGGGGGPAAIVDRRGQGAAGVAGELLAGGERVLILCADASRRAAGVERLLAGLARGPAPALGAWDELGAGRHDHVLALDPPFTPDALDRVDARALHLAWGAPEAAFALEVAERTLELRPSLEALYRELRLAGRLEGEALAAALRGAGPHPRPPCVAAALLRVVSELGIARTDLDARACELVDAKPTRLEHSPTYRRHRERLAVARGWLRGPALADAVPVAA